MTDPVLDHLTDAQREAVTHTTGPLLVVAGAGSGKTRVVTRRIAHLIRLGTPPHRILALTFTNKAAGEMKERVESLVGTLPRWVSTFHSACARFLRFDIDKLPVGRDRSYSIFDADDQKGLVKDILKSLNYDEKRFAPRALLERISRAKTDMIGPDAFPEDGYYDTVAAKVYAAYEKRLREMNAVDFDDLLVLTVRLLEACGEIRSAYRERFRFLLVDEYQDTNRAQYRLMRLLAGPERNVHATGDPDQSIYSWRGADYRNILDFQTDYPDARLVRLERNYRSTQTILDAANALIRHNTERIPKDLYTESGPGERLAVATLATDRDEAAWIVERIQALGKAGRPLRDIAVFYRTNAQSRPLEDALLREGMPYQIVGGIRFYERKEIRDLLAHLRLRVNPRDTVSLRRVVGCRPRGVGPKTLETIRATAEAHGLAPFDLLAREDFAARWPGSVAKSLRAFAEWCRAVQAVPLAPVDDAVEQLIRLSGLVEHIESRSERDPAAADRVENLNQFFERAAEYREANPEADLAAFLEEVALVADVDQWEAEADLVSLMTLHSAKGLEFPVVFIPGCEEGLLPHENVEGPAALEEERRLFYVGMTRAREHLHLTHAVMRFRWGETRVAPPSPFLREIPDATVEATDLTETAGAFGGAGDAEAEPFPDFDLAFGDDDAWDPAFDELDPDEPPPRGGNRLRRRGPRATTGGGGAFRAGDLVRHPVFGKGKVLSASRRQAVIQFFAAGTRALHLESADLRRC